MSGEVLYNAMDDFPITRAERVVGEPAVGDAPPFELPEEFPQEAPLAVLEEGYEGNGFWQTGDILEIVEPKNGHWSGANVGARNLSRGMTYDIEGQCGFVDASRLRPLTTSAEEILEFVKCGGK